MTWFHRLFRRPNGIHEIEDVKHRLSESFERQCFSTRCLSRSAETVSRQRRENELAESIARFRKWEGEPAE